MAADLPLEEQVGQLFMVGVSTQGLDETTAGAILDNHVGAAVLLGNTEAGAEAIAGITAELESLEVGVPLVVAVDQEGGQVQRLRGPGFTDIPDATQQGALPAGELGTQAEVWAEELADVGVHWNLAPVADVVPADRQDSNQPIGVLRRNYGNDVETVARAVDEYVMAMSGQGVATSLKHFPGLGLVVENTDFDAATDTDIVPGDARWQAFVSGMDAGASSVMVSSAVFANLDPSQEAVFSRTIITDILRGELAFTGVVIADDLGAAAAVADVPPAERGVRFIQAGGDVVINADPAIMAEMVDSTVELAGSDEDFADQVTASATRVLELKSGLGLVDCAV